ncbi:MAG: hypothetical protein JW864_10220 [Spirochaetes bacterium]|nr:hypothetical protein [Spirochaetota bacterium]
MKRNMILIIIGSIILNVAVSVFYFHKVKAKMLTFVKNQLEGNYITSISIEKNRRILNLSDMQVEKMKKININFDKLEEQYRKKFYVHLNKLKRNVLRENFDERNLRKVLEEIDKEKREIRILNLKEVFEFEEVLNQDQKLKFRNYIKRCNLKSGKSEISWDLL